GRAEEDLYDEREAVAGMEFVERVQRIVSKKGRATGSVVDRDRYQLQETEIDAGDKLKVQNKEDFGEVAGVDRISRTIDVRKGPSRDEMHPSAVFAFSYVPSEAVEGGDMRSVER